ncbi:MAG: hypothetical protein JJT88_09180 [Gammaproteobacteria bacterium]|nr:hypothetical protein [Gammaproteobacteria bacterium]
MYLAIEFVDAGRGVRLIARGKVPGTLIVEAHRTIAAEHLEAFARARYWFANHSALEGVLLEHSHARSVATIDERLCAANPGLVVGSLVPGDLEFGMVRTWQALADQTGWRVGTFRDEQKLRTFFQECLGRGVDLYGPADGPPAVIYEDSSIAVT